MKIRSTTSALFFAVAFASTLPVYAEGVGEIVVGNRRYETMEYRTEFFDSIDAGYGFDVVISEGSPSRVVVTTDKNIHNHLDISSRDGRLRLGFKRGLLYRPTRLEAHIFLPRLRGVELSGGSRAEIESGFPSVDHFALGGSGGSRLAINGFNCGSLTVQLSGGSRLEGRIDAGVGDARIDLSGGSTVQNFAGSAGELTYGQTGGGRVDLDGFEVVSADLDISGGSSLRVAVRDRIDIQASGGSNLSYRKSGQVDPAVHVESVSGGSSIQPF